MKKVCIFVGILFLSFPFMTAKAAVDTGFFEDLIVPPSSQMEQAIVDKEYDYYTRVMSSFSDDIWAYDYAVGEVGQNQYLSGYDSNGNKIYENFNMLAYHIWEVDAVFSLPYESYLLGEKQAGDIITTNVEIENSRTYEVGIEKSIVTTLSKTIDVNVNINMFKIGRGYSSSIQSAVNSSVKESTTYSLSQSFTATRNVKENGVFYSQYRGLFKMYIIISFSTQVYYGDLVNHSDGSSKYDVSFKYKVEDIELAYELINDTGYGIYRYAATDDGNLYYDDEQINDEFIYF